MKINIPFQKTEHSNEVIKFLVGGCIAVITDFCVYYSLVIFNLATVDSKLIAFYSGALVGFIINRNWTFKSNRSVIIQLVKYGILYSMSAFLNATVNEFILKISSSIWLGFIFATIISTVINYLGQKYFVFKND